MQISGPRNGRQQLRLWGDDIPSLGLKRYIIGDYVEQLLAGYFKAERLKTDSKADICPDLRLPTGDYAEVKSCGRSNQIILYEGRVAKYEQFTNEGNRLYYIVFCHDLETDNLTKTEDLPLLEQHLKHVLVAPSREVHKLVEDKPLKVMQRKLVDTPYHKGWSLGSNELKKHLTISYHYKSKPFYYWRTNET